MSSLDSLYQKLPMPFQNVACSLEGWRNNRSRYRGEFDSLLGEAESRTYWSQEQVFAYRDQRIREFVAWSATTVPYYRRLFKKLGIAPDDIRGLDDMHMLPVMTRQEVKRHRSELVSDAIPKKELMQAHTSGTTGSGLMFYKTLSCTREKWATWWRYRRWHGMQRDTWAGFMLARSVVPLSQRRPPFWRYNVPGRQILLSSFHLTPENLHAYLDLLRKRQPQWLHGYPSQMSLFAAYLLDSGEDLGYPIRWVTLGAENLLSQQKDLIERVFHVHPLQHFGMAEDVANFSECEHHALHVDEDFAGVEFIPTGDSGTYQVVGTNFTNPAFPLLRYDVHDVVSLGEKPCPCGRPGRVITAIDGRQEDYVLLRNGARLRSMDHIFKDIVNIRETQVYQERPGEIILRIVRGDEYTQHDEQMVLEETRKRVGDDATIDIEYTETLQRSETGKLRFVLSNIREAKIDFGARNAAIQKDRLRLVINAIPTRPSGGLTVLLGLLEAWRQADLPMHVTVLASHRDTLDAINESGWADRLEPLLVGTGVKGQFLWENLRLGSTLRAFRPDVLLTNNQYVHNLPCPQVVHHQDLWRFVDPTEIGITRSLPGERVRKWSAIKALRYADANVFVSHYIRQRAEALHPGSAARNHVIYNGLSDRVLRTAQELPDTFDGQPRLVAIQSANRHKDNPTLLRAMAELVRLRPDVDWQLDWAGSVGRSTLAPLDQLADELGVSDRVTWHGYCSQEQLGELLRQSLCLVFTSVLESFGLPPLEAMAQRCPTIAARATAIPEIVQEAGILVEPMNPVAFAEAVLDLYEHPAHRADLVDRGLRRIQDFSWRESATMFYDVIESVAGRKRAVSDESLASASG